jgi:hypothetical protein
MKSIIDWLITIGFIMVIYWGPVGIIVELIRGRHK